MPWSIHKEECGVKMPEHLLPFIWPKKCQRTWINLFTEANEYNGKSVSRNRTIGNNDHNNSSSSEGGEHYQYRNAGPKLPTSLATKTLNEKATCQTSSSSLSQTPFSFPPFLPPPPPRPACAASHLSVTERGLPWQFQHSVYFARRRRQRWVGTPAPQTLLHSVYFSSSSWFLRSVLNGLNGDMLGFFLRQGLWVYPSLS